MDSNATEILFSAPFQTSEPLQLIMLDSPLGISVKLSCCASSHFTSWDSGMFLKHEISLTYGNHMTLKMYENVWALNPPSPQESRMCCLRARLWYFFHFNEWIIEAFSQRAEKTETSHHNRKTVRNWGGRSLPGKQQESANTVHSQ